MNQIVSQLRRGSGPIVSLLAFAAAAEAQGVRHTEIIMSSVDYFENYFTNEDLNLPQLINDDFMEPIKLLFRSQHYVSTTKLLLIFVDTVGYIEYGESVPNPFVRWLTTYSELQSVGVTAEELWEHRNSLLHMSNLDSRKVINGSVKRLAAYVGAVPSEMLLEVENTKYYSLIGLIKAIANACQPWFESYNKEREKISGFVARYDLIASDARLLRVDFGKKVQG